MVVTRTTRWPRRGFALSLVLALSVVAAAQPTRPDAGRAARMKIHYGQALAVHDAIIRGDLAGAMAPARALAEDPPATSLDIKLVPYDTALRQAARRIAGTTDARAAGLTTAVMLAACGDCHRAAGRSPSMPTTDGGPTGGIVAHMMAHQRAVDQLMQGLATPSAALWREGAQALKAAPLASEKLPRDHKLTPEILEAEGRVHVLADTMLAAITPAGRVAAYGELITSCARCHGLHQTIWGPARK